MRALFAVATLTVLCGIASAYDSPPPQILWLTGQPDATFDGPGPDGAGSFGAAVREAFPGWLIKSAPIRTPVPVSTILVIAAPARDMSEAEAAALRLILAGDVRLLVCLDPEIDHPKNTLPRLRAVLREAGVEIGADRIMDPENQRAAAEASDGAIFAATFRRSDHALFRFLPTGSEIIFSNACRVAAMAGPKDPWDVREIATTGTSAFGQKSAGGIGPAGPVLVAAERRGGTGRFVVAGDSTFLTNSFATRTGQRGVPLGIAALKWLAEGIESPPQRGFPAAPGEESEPSILITAIASAAVLVIGAAVFARRK